MSGNEQQPEKAWTTWDRFLRRRYYTYPFLDKRLQFTFAALLAAIGIGNALYVALLFYLYSQEVFHLIISMIPDYDLALAILKDRTTHLRDITFGYIFIPEIVLIILWGLFFSHRISGPLHAISKKIGAFMRNEIPGLVHLRRNDFLSPFATQMNHLLERLSDRNHALEEVLDDLKKGNTSGGIEKLEGLILQAPKPGSASTHGSQPGS